MSIRWHSFPTQLVEKPPFEHLFPTTRSRRNIYGSVSLNCIASSSSSEAENIRPYCLLLFPLARLCLPSHNRAWSDPERIYGNLPTDNSINRSQSVLGYDLIPSRKTGGLQYCYVPHSVFPSGCATDFSNTFSGRQLVSVVTLSDQSVVWWICIAPNPLLICFCCCCGRRGQCGAHRLDHCTPKVLSSTMNNKYRLHTD